MKTKQKKPVKAETDAPWWAPLPSKAAPRSAWVAGVVLAVLLAAVLASRVAALPGSMWHQDEAEFASSVISFDIEWGRPHPPWFPLWVLIGKGVHACGVAPARSLQLASLVLSTAMVVPLILLWGLWLRRELAVAAALLFLFLPGVWMLSGRAFSDTPAAAVLVAAVACWLDPRAGRGKIAAGSWLAGLTVLLRPHHAVLLVGPLIVAWRRGADRRALLGPAALCGAAGATGLLVAAKGPGLLLKAVHLQSMYQGAVMSRAAGTFAGSGLARTMVQPLAGLVWLIAAAVGGYVLSRRKGVGAWALLAGVVVPSLLVLAMFVDPVEPRYWLPFLAFSSGLVVIALAKVSRRAAAPVVALAIAASAWVVVPQLGSFRHEVSPPLRALTAADNLASSKGGVVVGDLDLRPFGEYLRLSGQLRSRVVYDIELGRIAGVPPPWKTVAAYVDDNGGFVESGRTSEQFSYGVPLLERLVPGPYLTATVVDNARVRPRPQ
ncbi:MAG: hypothetical protein LJE95_01895 [Acidobacteria bacterium]|nr:hypothetical protein [Acidobacteriota bacterium]